MPIRDLLIEQASSAILEPISQQITYAVLGQLGLSGAFDNNIYITNDYSKPSITSDGDGHNALISKDRCDIKMTVIWVPGTKWDVNSFNYTQVYGVLSTQDKTLAAVFQDPIAGVRLIEHQIPCSMVLEFSLQFKNRESAFSTISVINNTSLRDSVINTHTLSYSYPISNDMFDSLFEIYQLRQDTAGVDFWNYLKRYSNGAIQYLQRRTGPQIELVIKRQDIRAMGMLEYTETAPTVQEQDHGIDRFVVDFTYTVQFARPDVLRLHFPVVICNQPIPEKMIRKNMQDAFDLFRGQFQEQSIGRYLNTLKTPTSAVMRLPIYDDFRPPQQFAVAAGFIEFFTAALYLDDTPTTTIDLMNLGGGLQLHATAAALIKLQGAEIFETTGLFNISIYCNGIPVDISCLSIDANLVVTLSMKNKLRRYHLVISEASSLVSLDEKWYPTFIANRTFFPVTVIKNIQRLIHRKYCYIDSKNDLLLLTNRLIQQNAIDIQIKNLIDAKHLNHYAYSYATTAEQFIEYLINTHSPVTQCPVYDEYVKLCVTSGLILESQLSTGDLQRPHGNPVLPLELHGTMSRFNLPLRIIASTVEVALT